MNFKLSNPLKVSVDGQIEETHELVFTAPSMKDRKQAARLEQIIARAQRDYELKVISSFAQEQIDNMKNIAESSPHDITEDDVKRDTLKSMISGSQEDIETLYDAFDTLAFRVCTVLDNVNLKKGHLEHISLDDYKRMCFEYIENFIQQ